MTRFAATLAASLLVAFGASAAAQREAPQPAAGPGAAAPLRVDPAALSAWWDGHRLPLPIAPLLTHADVVGAAGRAVAADPERLAREVIGQSVEGRDLLHLSIGRGPLRVLLWSQMHGDEPSATPALFDLLEWLRREGDTPAAARIVDRLAIHVVPMLNPDGAERFERRNAQGIDINRDALRLQTPEGRALKALRDRLQPALGFNLHNQNWQTSVGTPARPATMSLLAVAHDEARSDSPRRTLAKKTAAVIREVLDGIIPGRIGRYTDEFEVRAFGDNIGRWGTGVVLIETGPMAGPDPDPALTRLNFVALVTALDALASGRVEAAEPAYYESLPKNDSQLLHTLVTGATIVNGAGVAPFVGDIGIAAARVVSVRDGTRRLRWSGRIADLGDLRVYGALETIDATGLTAVPLLDPVPREGDEIRLPDWRRWRGATIRVGQPGALLLLSPVPGRDGLWRVVREIGY